MFQLVTKPIDVEAVLRAVGDPTCGGLAFFLGTVRNHDQGKRVLRLHYEAYESMALREMEKIGELCRVELGAVKVAIVHRLGTMEVGEASVVTAASAPHRSEAFRACQFLIDRLKQDVPIWKKEITDESAAWV
ncbi:MAG: molybdenum cofactor biosynthesis protein MoaE [Acidobacteriota bacterium]